VNSELHHHAHKITTTDKNKRAGHQSAVVWLTGLSASGKSTIANILETKLFDLGCRTHILDGDNVRLGLNSDLTFTPADRKENIRRIGEVANLFAESGMIAIAAFISPYEADRQAARNSCAYEFIEVHVACSLETCETRDPKGLYKKARAGIIKSFTGIDAPYEEPAEPEVVVLTDASSPGECADQIIEVLQDRGVMTAGLGEML
jgi:adenylylsulfate kinase